MGLDDICDISHVLWRYQVAVKPVDKTRIQVVLHNSLPSRKKIEIRIALSAQNEKHLPFVFPGVVGKGRDFYQLVSYSPLSGIFSSYREREIFEGPLTKVNQALF